MVDYLAKTPTADISNQLLFAEYIYFEDALNDQIIDRKAQNISIYDSIFALIPEKIYSLGRNNLEAKPLRFYEGDEIYKPFRRSLTYLKDDVLVYYLKASPHEPLGTLLFDKDTGKLISWILLK